MEVIGRDVPAGASPLDIAESREAAGFDGIGMRSGAGTRHCNEPVAGCAGLGLRRVERSYCGRPAGPEDVLE